MFIHRRAQLGLARVLAFLHIFITCVSPPLAVADDRLVTPAAHPGSARRLPNLSFRVIEGSNHGKLPAGVHAVPHRKSLRRGVNRDENYVPRREPVSASRRHAHHEKTDQKESHRIYENQNKNVNVHDSPNTMGRVPIHFWTTIGSDSEHVYGTNPNEDTSISNLEAKLHSSITLRVNIITVFGQLLKAPNNRLTADQYTSLNLVLQALAHKQVYMFNVLPILKRLQSANRETRFRLVMQALTNNVPAYLTSACKFWVNEIDKHQINIEIITKSIEHPADFLDGIDPEVIDTCRIKVAVEELEPIDEASELIKVTLGPVFVNVFVKLKNRQIKLSQKLFAAILANLPVGTTNPVFEEYIDYISDVAEENLLPNWPEIAMKIPYGNPYELVYFVIEELLNKRGTPIALKHALQYILLHLNEVPNTFSDEYYPDMQMILESNNITEKLLSMIPDDLTVPEQSDLRDQMFIDIKQVNTDAVFKGMNKYIYRRPIDLLIAILTRIQGRVPKKDIFYTVTKLLSVLVLKEELGSFTETVSTNVDIMILLSFLNVPDTDPSISAAGQNIQQYLDEDFNLLKNLQDLIPKDDKSKCRRPIQCLLYIFEEAMGPNTAEQLGISLKVLPVIEKLYHLIKTTINSSVKCKPHDIISAEPPEIPNDIGGVKFQLIINQPKTTRQPVLLTSPKPTEAHWSPVSIIPTDYKGNVNNYSHIPNDTVLPFNIVIGEIYPTKPGEQTKDKVPTRVPYPIKNVTYPDRWVQLVEVNITKGKPTRGPMPWPRPTYTTEVSPIPERPQTSRPSIAPPTSPPQKWVIVTTPKPYSTTRSPVSNPENLLPLHPENEPVLPPNIKYDRPIYVILPSDGAPPYTLPTKPSDTIDPETVISLPSIKELMQGFNLNTPFNPNELPDIPELMEPLKQALGVNFIEIILGKRVNKAQYPTVISLMNDVLAHALDNPNVIADFELVALIRKYRKGIDYISITALFPVVIDSQKISSDLLYVTFDPDNPNAYSVHSEEPGRVQPGLITLPIYHPKYWIQQVDPVNPYGTLIPFASEDQENPIQDLIDDGSLLEILGPDFDPFIYPNRGTLLTTVLQKLMVSPRVKVKPWLTKKLYAYLNCIRTIAMYSTIPNDYGTHFVDSQRDNEINWQPDTASLIVALPPARNQHEMRKIGLIRAFLSTPSLLQLLQIDNPPYSMTRGVLLKNIFSTAIRGNKMVLDHQTLSALKYYENKILITGHGALPIVWIWVQMFIIREEIPLGEIIEAVLDYQRLPHGVRLSYNQVMTYLTENPQFLQGNDDFPFEKYHTKGTFLRGLFSHLLSRIGISSKTKKNLKKLIPYVALLGRGSERMNHVTLDHITDHNIVPNGYSVIVNSY